jgi:hypothetical protein
VSVSKTIKEPKSAIKEEDKSRSKSINDKDNKNKTIKKGDKVEPDSKSVVPTKKKPDAVTDNTVKSKKPEKAEKPEKTSDKAANKLDHTVKEKPIANGKKDVKSENKETKEKETKEKDTKDAKVDSKNKPAANVKPAVVKPKDNKEKVDPKAKHVLTKDDKSKKDFKHDTKKDIKESKSGKTPQNEIANNLSSKLNEVVVTSTESKE